MNAQHTPGPWEIGDRDIYGADGFAVAEFDGVFIARNADPAKHPSEPGQCVDRSPDEVSANARLIAAAPELLEALEAVDSEVRLDGRLQDLVNAALAKAIVR